MPTTYGPDENRKETRARERIEMDMRVVVWPRSPSPPKLKSKPIAKPQVVAKMQPSRNEKTRDDSPVSKSKKSQKSHRKSDKSDKKKSERNGRSDRSPERRNNDHSERPSRSNRDDQAVEMEEKIMPSQASGMNSASDIQKSLHAALGLNEYERAEMERFRRDVQGQSISEIADRIITTAVSTIEKTVASLSRRTSQLFFHYDSPKNLL